MRTADNSIRRSGWDALYAIPIRSLFDPASMTQIVLAIGGAIVASRFEWTGLRELTRDTVIRLSALLGMHMHAAASSLTVMHFNGATFEFAMVCTWIMGYFGTAPLVWNLSQSLLANFARILLLGVFIFAMNIIRLELCFAAFAHGAPWVITHTVITGGFGFLVYLAVVAQIDHPFARFLLRGPADGDTVRRIARRLA